MNMPNPLPSNSANGASATTPTGHQPVKTAEPEVPLLGPEFTAKLLEHFHRAKRLALADQETQVTAAS